MDLRNNNGLHIFHLLNKLKMKHINFKSRSIFQGLRLKTIISLSICLLLTGIFSCGNNQTNNDSVDSAMNVNDQKVGDSANNTLMNADADFAVKAANGGMAEVQLGKIAKEKASNEKVKEFAAKMVKDHSGANKKLKAVAKKLNIALPASIDQEKQDEIDKLNATAVEDFDKVYIDMMVEDHNKDVDFFQMASKDISNTDLHNFIVETLPVLQSHQKLVKQIDNSLK